MRTFDIQGEFKSLWQWDVNRRLVVNEYCDQVHFANRTTSEALTLQVYEENGQRLVNVPNILLQTDGPLEVYAYVMGPSERYTKKDCRFRVLTRPRPADYVYTEVEILNYETLEKRMEAIEETGVSEEQLAKAVEAYLSKNPVGVPNGGKAGQYLRKKSDTDRDVEWADFEIPQEYGLITYDQDRTITIT
jgi:hypothetical protein